jgi:hypothetical protein
VEQSQSFRFLQTEHLGTISFFGLTILPSNVSNSSGQGWLMWRFYAKDTNNYITMGTEAGEPYYIGCDNPFQYPSPPNNYPSSQTIKESFEQIDALGLKWFNNRAIEIYQKQTGMNATMSGLEMDIFFDNQENYQGITILLFFTVGNVHIGNGTKPTVYRAEFQPNGTLLSFNT